jgi:segregation and condensation protein A
LEEEATLSETFPNPAPNSDPTDEAAPSAHASPANPKGASEAATVPAGGAAPLAAEPAPPTPPAEAEADSPKAARPAEPAPKLPFPAPPEPAAPTTADKVAAALKARRQYEEQSPFSVLVDQVYEGPLDLLLDLIRKQDIDIYDIPIAKITAQFLAYVDQLRASDMDVAGEFIYTASLLIHIKSRMLLPRASAGPGEAGEDPRRELVERLLEHERFKNAAQMLQQKQLLEAATWTNPGVREFQDEDDTEPEIAADTGDLVRVFHLIIERARNRPIFNVTEDSVTVGQMIQFLARRLTMEDKPVALRRLLSHTRSEQALIALFLALLELVRLQAILLRQDRHFSEIFIKKSTGFDAVLNRGLADARDDWR